MLRRLVCIVTVLCGFFAGTAIAEDIPPTPKPIPTTSGSAAGPPADRVIIQVNGIVCSFCAHGLEKALSKLTDLDASEYGNGVLVDIESQKVTLAFRPAAVYPFSDIHRRIKKAGYDPVRFDFRVTGVLEDGGTDGSVIRNASGQRFSRGGVGQPPAGAEIGQAVDWAVSLAAERAAEGLGEEPIQVEPFVEG